jgi:hypothetical protein
MGGRLKPGSAVVLVVVGLVAVLAVREAFDPWLALYLDDWFHPKPDPVTAALAEDVRLRLYTGTRPHIGKVDELQKGLVLVVDGRELIEEGFGFGNPIVSYGDRTYHARHATVARSRIAGRDVLTKRYAIDVADYPSQFLRAKYRDVEPLGTVTFTYTLAPPETISVTVDLTGLTVDWDRVYVMNEQGARAFPVYSGWSGSTGAEARAQTGDEVGIWRRVVDPCGCWSMEDARLAFCVKTEPQRVKYIGRERYWQYHWAGVYTLSWSGVDLELKPSDKRYSYVIYVRRAVGTEAGGRDVGACP